MEQEAGQMVPTRVEPVKLTVEHVRDPRKRVPTAEVAGSKGPAHGGYRQAGLDLWIPGNVILVIHIDKIVGGHRPIADQRQNEESERYLDQAGWGQENFSRIFLRKPGRRG